MLNWKRFIYKTLKSLFRKRRNKVSVTLTKNKNIVIYVDNIRNIISLDAIKCKSYDSLYKHKSSGHSKYSYEKLASSYFEKPLSRLQYHCHILEIRWHKRHIEREYEKNTITDYVIGLCKDNKKIALEINNPIRCIRNGVMFDGKRVNICWQTQISQFLTDIYEYLIVVRLVQNNLKKTLLDIYTWSNGVDNYKHKVLGVANFNREIESYEMFSKHTGIKPDIIGAKRSFPNSLTIKIINRSAKREIDYQMISAGINILIKRVRNFRLNIGDIFPIILVLAAEPQLSALVKMAVKYTNEKQYKCILLASGWELSWAFYLAAKKFRITCNCFYINSPDPDVHILRRPGDTISTISPFMYKQLKQRKGQIGTLLTIYNKTKIIREQFETKKTCLLWFESEPLIGRLSLVEIYSSLKSAIAISNETGLTLMIKNKPQSNPSKHREQYKKMIENGCQNFQYCDELDKIENIAKHCRGTFWTYSTALLKAVPHTDTIILDFAPASGLVLENCKWLSNYFLIEDLKNYWNQYTPEEKYKKLLNDTSKNDKMDEIKKIMISRSYCESDQLNKSTVDWERLLNPF